MMKLLFISPRFSGGIGGHAAMLAEQLTKYGFKVEKLEVPHIPNKNLKNTADISRQIFCARSSGVL